MTRVQCSTREKAINDRNWPDFLGEKHAHYISCHITFSSFLISTLFHTGMKWRKNSLHFFTILHLGNQELWRRPSKIQYAKWKVTPRHHFSWTSTFFFFSLILLQLLEIKSTQEKGAKMVFRGCNHPTAKSQVAKKRALRQISTLTKIQGQTGKTAAAVDSKPKVAFGRGINDLFPPLKAKEIKAQRTFHLWVFYIRFIGNCNRFS